MIYYKNEDIKSIEYTRNVFRVKWRLTSWCNYHCNYCINSNNIEKVNGWNTNETLINRAIKINNMLKLNNIQQPIHLNLLGGEVCFFNLKEIISKIDNISNLNITTNFSNALEWYKDMFIWCKEHKIKLFINCSDHKVDIKFKDKFIELTQWCKENKFSLPRLSFVITEKDNVNETVDEYFKEGITKIILHKVKSIGNDIITDQLNEENETQVYNYNINYEKNLKQPKDYKVTFKDGSVAEFTSISNFLSLLDNNGFIPDNFYCYSGIKCILIEHDGKIYRTNCQELFTKSIGNVDTDNIILPKEPYLCQNTTSRCCLRNGTSVYKNNSKEI